MDKARIILLKSIKSFKLGDQKDINGMRNMEIEKDIQLKMKPINEYKIKIKIKEIRKAQINIR